MGSMVSGCGILLVVTVAHFIGVHGSQYQVDLMKQGDGTEATLNLVDDCVLSYHLNEFACQNERQNMKGIMQKENGEWVSFNRLTGWWKARSAVRAIYAATSVMMTVKKGQAVFRDSVSGSEAFFTLGARSVTEASEASQQSAQPTYMLRASEKLSDASAAAGWNRVSFDGVSWRLVQSEYSCPRGVALVPKNGNYKWTMFGRLSLFNKRKAVAFICPENGVKLKENQGFAEFRFQYREGSTQRGKVLMLRLEYEEDTDETNFSPPDSESFFYIRYRPNGKTRMEPGIMKVPVGRKCLVTKGQQGWTCAADDDKDTTKLKGLWLRANPATAYSLLNPITERKNVQPYGPAAYFYPGDGVKLTTTLYVPFTARKATFRDKDTKETAVFYLGDVTPVFPAEEADVERTAFAKRLMDNGDHFKLRLHSTDGEYTELLVNAATGFLSYSNGWQYNGRLPDRADKGVAIFEPVETAVASRVAYFKGDRPLQATAVVYAGPNVKISQSGDKVYFTEKSGGFVGYIRVGDSQIKLNHPDTAKRCLAILPYEGRRHLRCTTVNVGTNWKFTAKLGYPIAAGFEVDKYKTWTLGKWCDDVDIRKLGEGPFLVVTAVAKRFEDDVTLHLAVLQKLNIPVAGVVALFHAGDEAVFVFNEERPHDILIRATHDDLTLAIDSRTPVTARWGTGLSLGDRWAPRFVVE